MIVEQITILRGLLRRASSISRHQHGQGFRYTQRVFEAKTRCAVAIYHTFPCAIDQGKDFGKQRLFPGVTGNLYATTIAVAGQRKPLGNETMRRLTPQTSADDEQLREFPNLPASEHLNPALKVSPG